MFVNNIFNDELIRKKHEGHLFFEFDLFLNQINEKMNSSKPQTSPLYSKKTEHHLSKSQTVTKPMTRPDQQTQIKTGTFILFFTRIMIHTSSAKWNFFSSSSDFFEVFSSRTIILNDVTVAHQTIEISNSNSHWFIIFNFRVTISQFKKHVYWIPIAFHITTLSINTTNHVTIWVSISTTSFQICRCVSDANSRTSIFSEKNRCGNEKSENATIWTVNKFEKIIGPTVVIIADIFHKWKNTTARSTLIADQIKIIVFMSSQVLSVADESRIFRLFAVKNQAHSNRAKKHKLKTTGFLFFSIAVCTMFNKWNLSNSVGECSQF